MGRPSCGLHGGRPIAIHARRIGVGSEVPPGCPGSRRRDLAWRRVRPPQTRGVQLRFMRTALPLALAVGVVAAAPGVAGAKALARAHAAGGDVVTLQYPSLVKTRVGRAQRALHRAVAKIENGQGTQAATTFKVVRRQMAAAWRGTKYVIRTTPPPPATEDAFRPRARKSGGAPVGPTLAAPADTAMLVLTLQHKVAANVIQLIDGAHGTGLNALATTLNFSDDRRDGALSYILSVAPPVPQEASVHA